MAKAKAKSGTKAGSTRHHGNHQQVDAKPSRKRVNRITGAVADSYGYGLTNLARDARRAAAGRYDLPVDRLVDMALDSREGYASTVYDEDIAKAIVRLAMQRKAEDIASWSMTNPQEGERHVTPLLLSDDDLRALAKNGRPPVACVAVRDDGLVALMPGSHVEVTFEGGRKDATDDLGFTVSRIDAVPGDETRGRIVGKMTVISTQAFAVLAASGDDRARKVLDAYEKRERIGTRGKAGGQA